MHPLLLSAPVGRTQWNDEHFAAIGRMLTLATRFENGCKHILNFAKVVSTMKIEESELELERVLQKTNLNNSIQHIVQNLDRLDPELNISQILIDARLARNSVAHELTFLLAELDDFDENYIESSLKPLVITIARADFYVSIMNDILSDIGVPQQNAIKLLNSYIDTWVDWVCEIDM